jgi:hypothetical protein
VNGYEYCSGIGHGKCAKSLSEIMSGKTIICIMDHAKHYYDWWHVPLGQYTKKQLLKRHRRLNKNAEPVGTITCVFDKPRCRPKNVEAVPPDECEQFRKKLVLFGPDATDQPLIYRLDQAGQLVTMNLYDIRDTERITSFTEAEAKTLLGYMLWDDSHEDHYITEATEDGERKRATWKHDISTPDLNSHLAGERYFGAKKGRRTMQIVADCDRHSDTVPGDYHITKVLKVGRVLSGRFHQYRFAPEINKKNGSVKFFGWLTDYMPIYMAERIGEDIRKVLTQELPEYDFTRLEIYPSSSPQIFAPLRADKTTVIDSGVLEKVKRHKYEVRNGNKSRIYYDAYSCAAYLNWIYFSVVS